VKVRPTDYAVLDGETWVGHIYLQLIHGQQNWQGSFTPTRRLTKAWASLAEAR
jgi:hypothetical protein